MKTNILITGGTGLVGKAIQSLSPENSIFISSSDYDLTKKDQTIEMFDKYKPKKVIHLSGKVGGVKANMDNPVQFYADNVNMSLNIMDCAHKYGVQKLVCTLSSCIYPDRVEYPIKEDYLHLGPPHESNFAYSYAKRILEVQMRSYRKQYGCNFIGAIPTNIFGEYDNFNLNDSHVIPAIIRKIYEAKKQNKSVSLWGDGSPLRQFTYSKDIAKILLWLADNECLYDLINIGDSKERSIKEVATTISNAFNFSKNIEWDTNMPRGQFKKPCDMSRLKRIGFNSFTDFDEAIVGTVKWFEANYNNARL